MAATMRVFATDSYMVGINAQTDGITAVFTLSHDQITRTEPLSAVTEYDFSAKKTWPVPPIQSAFGTELVFHFTSISALRGKRITGLQGPFIYLRDKYGALLTPDARSQYDGFHFGNVFLRFLSEVPSPDEEDDSNRLGRAKLGAYVNISPNGRQIPCVANGAQLCPVTVRAVTCPMMLGKRYYGSVQAIFDSHAGQYPPYLEVTYEDTGVEAANCSPRSGFINEQEDALFTWSIAPSGANAVGGVMQASAVFQWRVSGAGDIHTLPVPNELTWLRLPGGTLPNGKIDWRVQVAATTGQQSPFSPWYTLTTEDPHTLPPDNLSPNGCMIDAARAVTFSWRHNAPLSTPSSAFEAAYSYDENQNAQTIWYSLADKTAGSATHFILPPGQLASGTFAWRVRDYNSDGFASPWSNVARVTVRAAPSTPVLRSLDTALPRPVVSWIAQSQAGFQLIILDTEGAECYDSGSIPSREKTWRAPCMLENGPHRFRLRVQNSDGLWSDWAQADAVTQFDCRLRPVLSGEAVEGGALLVFTTEVLG